MKLRDLLNSTNKKIKLNESWGEQESNQMTTEDKKAFMETVANFNTFGESIYREANFQEMVENIAKMIEGAKQVALSEGDWFDGVTVQRHMKGLGESYKVFEKTCKEMSVLQQRLEACYEDIGGTLGKYFNINELTDEGNAFGAAVQKAKKSGDDEFEVDGKKYDLEEEYDEYEESVKPSTHGYNPKVKDVDKKYGIKKKNEYHGPSSTGYNPSAKDVDKKYGIKKKKKK